MKKFILAVSLLICVPAYATQFYTDEDLEKRIEFAGNTDMLESYKQGLEKAKAKKDAAEIEVKLAELTLAVAELERQILITTEALNELEKNK